MKTLKITSKHKHAIYLVIVESPSKCAKIEGFLGSQYMCIASMGHLRQINGLKSIDVKNNYIRIRQSIFHIVIKFYQNFLLTKI